MSRQTLDIPSFSVTRLSPSASLAQALKVHWREYLMEAAELGVLMFSICLFGTLLYSSASPLKPLGLSRVDKGFLMGIAVASTTFLIIRSPFGRRTGAHFNPAITLTYFYLGRVHRWDTLCYIASQFVGALVGVFVAREILGQRLAAAPFATSSQLQENMATSSRLLRSSPCRDCLWLWCSLLRIAGL